MRAIQSTKKCLLFPSLVWFLVSIHCTQNTNVLANQDQNTKAYIVYMGEREHNDIELITESHHGMLASALGSNEAAKESMIYSYRHGFSAFAAKLTESQAQYFAGLPGVIDVLPNILYEVQTTRSMDYLGLSTTNPNSLLNVANQGDGVIIGVIDSGIWPESDSLSDAGLGPIPPRWMGGCDTGDQFNPATDCNRKLIGARYFIAGLRASYTGPLKDPYFSPRDFNGHGTHCATTAVGAFVPGVNVDGLALGTARGAAPRARLAVYKVFWDSFMTSVDVLAAFDQAIGDGVDVLSVSLGYTLPVYPETDGRDVVFYGSYHANARGITVVCAGGNSGPVYGTVVNVAPWVITVAASTMDRSFDTGIYLGDFRSYTGLSMYVGPDTEPVELYYQEKTDFGQPIYCESLVYDPLMAGKIVLCFTEKGTESDIIQARNNVYSAGGLGLIATKKNFRYLSTFYGTFPCVLVTFDVGTQILNYIRSTSGATARLLRTVTYTGSRAITQIASLSSRGPNTISPSVLKPDIAAPGIDILAATIPGELGLRTIYNFQSGTSMATPHVAGIVAMLKVMCPNCSPAAIKSAIVTKAWTNDPYSGETIFAGGDTPKVADPFDYGGGIINPNSIVQLGIIYDIETQDYVNYLCAMGYSLASIRQLTGGENDCPTGTNSVLDLNLPSITVPNLSNTVTVRRSLTNVGIVDTTYNVANIDNPLGIEVSVNPDSLYFGNPGTTQSFTVTITTSHTVTTEYFFGSLTWTRADGSDPVRIPISVKTEIQ